MTINRNSWRSLVRNCRFLLPCLLLLVSACSGDADEGDPYIPGVSICIESEPVGMPSPTGPGGCFCWEPPYCWCLFPGGMITTGCSTDGSLCCSFHTTCQPCGWTDVTHEDKQMMPSDNSSECQDLLDDMNDWDRYDWKQCLRWENP